MFSEEIGVLDHGAFQRLEDHAALFQVVRNNVALDKLIVGKDHSGRAFAQAARIFQYVVAIILGKRVADFKRRKIEKIDTRESPELIFAGRSWKRLKLFPGRALLFTEPIGQLRIPRAGEDSCISLFYFSLHLCCMGGSASPEDDAK